MHKVLVESEMGRFNSALRRVLSVSKSNLQRLLAEEKASKVSKRKPGPRSKTSASDRVSRESD